MLARKEFDSAKTIFSQTAEEFPAMLEPRILLSYAYLQEGKDWDAAEQALHAVLALDPGNKEARNNLTVLCRQQGKEVALCH
jgi:Flp pilus assembly protein TadD